MSSCRSECVPGQESQGYGVKGRTGERDRRCRPKGSRVQSVTCLKREGPKYQGRRGGTKTILR